MPRQMINLIAIVLIAGLLFAGTMLVVLPFYGSARTIETSAREVAQTNDVYQLQVDRLAEARARIDEIAADVGALRLGIPASARLDDVMQIVVEAAEATGASIEGFQASDPEAWTPRTGLGGDDAGSAPTDGPATAEPAATGEAGAPAPTPSPPAAPGELEGQSTQGEETDAAASPQRQIPVTITVAVPSAETAAAFLDALGRGPRLLLPIDGTLDETTLTVTALAFVRTED